MQKPFAIRLRVVRWHVAVPVPLEKMPRTFVALYPTKSAETWT